jgi:hypothetical protein
MGAALGELGVSSLEWPCGLRSTRVQGLECLVDPPFGSGRPEDLKWPRALGELAVEDQPGQAAEVVAM